MDDPRLAQAADDAHPHPAKPDQAAKRLKALRRAAGLSLRDMARELGLSPTSYQHYEDRFKRPYLPGDLATRVIGILASRGLPATALAGLAPPAAGFQPMLGMRSVGAASVPLLTWKDIGGDRRGAPMPILFALHVEGTALDRIAPPGAVILIDTREVDPMPGRYYLASTSRGAAARRLAASGRLVPWSTIPGHTVLTPGPQARIIGRIIRVVTDI